MTIIRNDSGMSVDAAMAVLKADGVELVYGDIKLLTERAALEAAQRWIAALTPDDRTGVMNSVDQALRRGMKKVANNTASKKQMDAFYSDLLLWTALQEQTAS